MKKISLSSLILLVVGIVCWLPQAVYASCDEQKIEQEINQTAQKNASAALNALKDYNAAVSNYESSCGKINNKGTQVAFPPKAVSSLLVIDQTLGSMASSSALFENTGISWPSLTPANENCKKLATNASEALNNYNGLRSTAVLSLGAARREGNSPPMSCVCPENSNEEACTSYLDSAEEEQKSDDCYTFPTYLSAFSSCPLCPIFQTLLDTNNRVATIAWDTMSGPLQTTLKVFFLVFLALETLRIIANFSGANIGGYLKSILTLGFKVAIAIGLLTSSKYVYGMFISPVIQSGMNIGVTMASTASSEASACFAVTSEAPTSASGVLSPALLNGVMSTVRCFGTSAAIMPAIGAALSCHGWFNKVDIGLPSITIVGDIKTPELNLTTINLPDVSMFLCGVLFLLGGIAIWIVIAFYLIDCTVQLGIVSTLVPFFIACWPFRVTQTYTIKGAKLIMNTFFNFLFMGIIMLVGSEIVSAALGKGDADMQSLIVALNMNDIEQIKTVTGLDSLALVVLFVCCVFAFKLIEKVNQLANKFSESANSQIGANLGGVVGGMGMAAAKTATNTAVKVAEVGINTVKQAEEVALAVATFGGSAAVEAGAEGTAEVSAEVGAEVGSEAAAEAGAQAGAEAGTEATGEVAGETAQAATKTAEEASEEVAKDTSESLEDVSKDVADKSLDKDAEQESDTKSQNDDNMQNEKQKDADSKKSDKNKFDKDDLDKSRDSSDDNGKDDRSSLQDNLKENMQDTVKQDTESAATPSVSISKSAITGELMGTVDSAKSQMQQQVNEVMSSQKSDNKSQSRANNNSEFLPQENNNRGADVRRVAIDKNNYSDIITTARGDTIVHRVENGRLVSTTRDNIDGSSLHILYNEDGTQQREETDKYGNTTSYLANEFGERIEQ